MTVHIYGTIGSGLFADIGPEDVRQSLAEEDDDEIVVAINSGGGDLFAGIAIMNELKRHDAHIIAHIDGLAASAASIIAMGADEVRMPESAMMMIHNPWGLVAGDYQEMEKAAEDFEKMRDSMLRAYSTKTGLDDDELKDMLDDETWLSAEEAVKDGFADKVLKEDETDQQVAAMRVAACQLNQFDEVPDQLAAMARRGRRSIAAAKRPAAFPTKGEEMDIEDENETPDNSQQTQTVDAESNVAARKSSTPDRSDVVDVVKSRCENAGLSAEDTLEIVASATTEAEAKDMIIDALSEQDEAPEFSGRSSIHVGETDDEKHREAMSEAILMRAGVEERDPDNPYLGQRLDRMAETCVRRAGMEPATNTHEFGKQAFAQVNSTQYASGGSAAPSSSDFPAILEDTINKQMLVGWELSPETWQEWTRQGSLSDFREASRTSLNLMDELEEIGEGEEYSRGTTTDRKEKIQLGKYGKIYGLTWEAVINDDLGAFTRRPQKIGRRAAALPGDLAYAVLTGNDAMNETGNPLFDEAHNNDATDDLTHSAIQEMVERMQSQTAPETGKNKSDGELRTLNIQPSFIIVPTQLRFSAQKIIQSPGISGDAGDVVNPVQDIVSIVVEPRLSQDSHTRYYMAADPNMFDTVEVAFLNGQSQPFMDVRDGWDIDGTEMKVRLPCAAAPLDYRTMQRNGSTGT